MRAGRLLNLLLVLQNGGRFTARDLAQQLGVSVRTVRRDIDTLSQAGVPVYGVRGPGGGFTMLDTFEQSAPPLPPGLTPGTGRLRRVRVRLAPAALQLALATGRPEGWRSRPGAQASKDRPDWLEGSFRFDSDDAAVRELLALGSEVEVLLPTDLRHTMAAIGRRIARLHHLNNNEPANTTPSPPARKRSVQEPAVSTHRHPPGTTEPESETDRS